MSFKAMAWASKQKTGNSTRKFVLMMLADKANDSGTCWPSHKTIMSDCEIGSKTTLVNHLSALEESGLIEIIHRSKDGVSLPNHYKLKIGGVVQKMNWGSPKNELGDSPKNEPKPINNKPINEPIKNNKKSDSFYTTLNSFNFSSVVNVSLEMYKENCRELGYKKTQRAWSMIFNKVSSIVEKSGDAVAVECINQSIERGYKSVFEPSANKVSNFGSQAPRRETWAEKRERIIRENS